MKASKRLTDSVVKNLEVHPTRRLEVPDPAIPGFYVIVQPSGAKSFALRFRAAGKPRKLTLGRYPAMTLSKARAAALEALEAIDHGADPASEKAASKAESTESRERDTIDALVDLYAKRHLAKKRSGAGSLRYLERELVEPFSGRDVKTITRRDLVDLLDKIVDRGSPITANRVHAHARALFNWAVGRGVLDANPLLGLKKPIDENARDRFLTPDEVALFWRATEELGQPFGPLYRLLLLTGQRLREAAHMRDHEIDGDVWTIPGDRAKNGDPHTVPLSPLALQTLKSIKRIGDKGWIFTTNGDTPVSGFAKGKARLDKVMARLASDDAGEPVKIKPFVIHDLRRTAASGMAELRIAPHVCEAVLNHRSGTVSGVAAVYNRYTYTDEKREALEAWARRVDSIVTGQSANVIELEARR